MSNRHIPQTVRNSVWLKYMGEVHTGKCYCCKLELISKGVFECGHVISDKKGGKITLDNLRPICSLCNKSMGTKNMDEFMKEYYNDSNEILEYLRTLNDGQLRLLCKWNCLPYHENTEMMIENLQHIDDLKVAINTDMSFIVKCNNNKCIRCKYTMNKNIMECDCGSHYYYTNTQMSPDYVCEVCDNTDVSFKKNYFKIHEPKCNENKHITPNTQKVKEELIKMTDEKSTIEMQNFSHSEILSCKIGNDNVEKLNYANILFQVLLHIGNKSKILKTYSGKYMNFSEEKKTLNGYKYYDKLQLSIQNADSNHTLKEIKHICEMNKINLQMDIKLRDGIIIKIR